MPPKRRPWGSGTVRKVGPDAFQIRWSLGTDPFTGKHLRKAETLHGVTKAEAQRILNQRQATRRLTTRMTLGELIDAALPQMRVTEATRQRYEFVLRRIPDGARAWPVADITVSMADDLIGRLNEMHGAAEVRKLYSALMSVWKIGGILGWVNPDDNPFSSKRIVLPKKPKGAGKLLTDEQIRALIAVADPGQEHTWIMLHVETGARPGEVASLRWSAVDLGGAVVHFTDEKHKGIRRPVAVTQDMVDQLAAWRIEQGERQPVCADPYLFSNAADASKPWSRFYVRQRWHRLANKAGVPTNADGQDGYRLYDVRHTVNSWLAGSGMPSHVRGLRAGNSAKVNEDVYTHMAEAENRAAAEWIRSRLG